MIRVGKPPYLECSTKGDKRFSAFCARIKAKDNKSIEELYQAAKIFQDGTTNLSWREAKGKRATNQEYLSKYYDSLWIEYILENKHLVNVIIQASGLSDKFGQVGHNCQAITLWKIREYIITHN